MKADEALSRLKDGNDRFARGMRSVSSIITPESVARSASGQSPFAIVLACSDSRVPVETIFDQGLGDLFVMRVAGNVVAPSIIGSAEFAASNFGTRLIVVLGHSNCGAVAATVDVLRRSGDVASPNIRDLVERIRPAAKTVVDSNPSLQRDELVEQSVRANVRLAVDKLRHGSEVIEQLTSKEGLMIVGAEYDLRNGRVEMLET